MSVRRFMIVLIAILLAQSAIAQDDVQIVTGYGPSKERALQDAFMTAVQMSVGVLIDTEIYVQNGQIIDEKVIAHSEGFIEKFDIVAPFDGISITIIASVKTKYLSDELNLYSKPQIDEQGAASAEMDMGSLFAKYDSQQKLLSDRKQLILTQGDAIFNELMHARSVIMRSHSNPVPIDDSNENFRITLSLEQEVNEIRYASAINKLQRLFINVGAEISYQSRLVDSGEANTIMLENINGTAIAYTFDAETFKAFNELFYNFKALNQSQAIKINFIDNAIEGSRVLASSEYSIEGTYFTDISPYTDFGSFIIFPRLSRTKLQLSVDVNRRNVESVDRIVSEYNQSKHEETLLATIAKDEANERAQIKQQEYDANLMKFGYLTTFGVKVGMMTVDEALMHDNNSIVALGFEANKFLTPFPYIGAGLDFTYASGSCDENSNACNATELTLMDMGARVIVRYPIEGIELYAAAAVSYTMLDTSNAWLKYEDQFLSTSIEAGVTISTYLGLRYRHYIAQEEFSFNYEIVGMTRDSFELILQYGW